MALSRVSPTRAARVAKPRNRVRFIALASLPISPRRAPRGISFLISRPCPRPKPAVGARLGRRAVCTRGGWTHARRSSPTPWLPRPVPDFLPAFKTWLGYSLQDRPGRALQDGSRASRGRGVRATRTRSSRPAALRRARWDPPACRRRRRTRSGDAGGDVGRVTWGRRSWRPASLSGTHATPADGPAACSRRR